MIAPIANNKGENKTICREKIRVVSNHPMWAYSTRVVFHPFPSPRIVRTHHACRTLPPHQWDHHMRGRESGGHASEARAAKEEEEEKEQEDDDEKRRGGGGSDGDDGSGGGRGRGRLRCYM